MTVIDWLRRTRDTSSVLTALHRRLRGPYYWVLESLYPRGISACLSGRMPVRLYPHLMGMRPETYEPILSAMLDRHTPKGGTVIDIGAHVGLHTLRLSERVGRAGRVIAVEPSPANSGLLRVHLTWNNCHNVEIMEAVIGDREDQVEFTFRADPTDPGGFANSLAYDIGGETRKVRMTTIDEICSNFRPDLIKIDIEGAEFFALRGARETLTRMAPVVIVAVHPEPMRLMGTTPAKLVALMSEYGYNGVHLDGRKVSVPGFEEILFEKRAQGNG